MAEKKPILTKVCIRCGLRKVLANFVIASSMLGEKYGDICASCRKKAKQKKEMVQDPDDATRSSTGFKIDHKAKVQAERDKREIREAREESEKEEHAENEELQLEQIEKREKRAHEEREHREEKEKTPVRGEPKKEKIFGQPDSPADVDAKEQQMISNPNAPFMDTYIPGKRKYGVAFETFSRWARASAIGQEAEKRAQASKGKAEVADKKNTMEKSKDQSTETPKDLPEYVQNTWGKKRK